MEDVMQRLGLTTGVISKRVIVQGLGNVVGTILQVFREHGAKW